MAAAQILALLLLALCSHAEDGLQTKNQMENYLDIPLIPDPLEIDNIDVNLDEDLIAGNFRLNDLVITGGKIMKVDIIDAFTKFKGSVTLVLTGNYFADGQIMNLIPIKGEGDLDIQVPIEVAGRVELSGENMLVFTKFNVDPVIKITGLKGDEHMSDLISRQLTDLVKALTVEFEIQICDFLTCFVERGDIEQCLSESITNLYSLMQKFIIAN